MEQGPAVTFFPTAEQIQFSVMGLGKCSGVDDIFAKMAHFTTKMLIFLHNWTEKSITRIKSHVLKNFPQSQPRTKAQPQNVLVFWGLWHAHCMEFATPTLYTKSFHQ